ncbi:cytochrome P450 [Alicyclobacillus fodiniaquatilis]|uniref:Cytochrome P450 n=1 Tax=Alicyclobacillus fodiniaquatilis TaxID=1661150 RepID=A0ABW4JR50_9BACL
MSEVCLFNPYDPAFLADPYTTYRTLLNQAPLFKLPADFLQRSLSDTDWCLSRYEDVSLALRDRRFVREWENAKPAQAQAEAAANPHPTPPPMLQTYFAGMNSMMLFRDPPAHTRLRTLVNKAFTPIAIESLRPRITDLVEYLLQPLTSGSQVDLISEFALPLPVMVIAEMLGVAVADRDLFKSWSLRIARSIDATLSDPQVLQEAAEAYRDLSAYLKDVIADHRRHPREDILTNLIRAEEDGERLNEQELLSSCIILLVAGHETTTNLIGNGFWTLHRHPDARELWREQPEWSTSAVEEILRFEPPVQRTMRYVSDTVQMGDVLLSRGDSVYLLLAAANRDPAVFANPDVFDITRKPNRHLSFAAGIHFCLGAPLARLEGEIALTRLAQSSLVVDSDVPLWRNMTVLRGLEALQAHAE